MPNSYAVYEPFGAFLTTPTGTNPSVTDRGFTGHRHNNTGSYNFGLIYMNARYCHPQLGRFVSPDTIVPEPGNPQAFNRYGYGLNNPPKYRDPSGHWFESALDIAFIAYDIYDIRQHGLNWVSGLSLAADVVGLIVPMGTGGGVAVRALAHADDVADVVTHVDEAVEVVSHVEDVYHATNSAECVLKGINPEYFRPENRFGEAFYVASDRSVAIAEAALSGKLPSHVIRFQLDLGKASVLDLTSPEVAKAGGFVDDAPEGMSHRAIGQRAASEGYNAIRFRSFRGEAVNHALFDNFNFSEWLKPVKTTLVSQH